MDFIRNIILAALCIVLFGSSMIFIWILMFRPKWIGLQYYHPDDIKGWAKITPWVTTGAFFALLTVLWIGLNKVLFFIPESWSLTFSVDGEPESVKYYLVYFLTTIFSFYIFYIIIIEHSLKNFRLKYCDRKSHRKICEEKDGLMNKMMRPPVIISVIMLLLAIFPFPYGYYTLLRLVVCGTAIYLTWFAKLINKMGW